MRGQVKSFFRIMANVAGFLLLVETSGAGVLARFQQGDLSDAIALPHAALFVAAGSPPTSLLETGNFVVRIEGSLSVDLRAQYAFQVESGGEIEVLINDKPVLASSGGGLSELSKPVRLNKGTNSLLIKLAPSKGGDTQFRLFWKSRNMARAIPIPAAALNHDAEDPVLRRNNVLRRGAAALADRRCTRCHQTERRGFPELEMDSPDLSLIGSRLRQVWMAKWIANPSAGRPGAHMPRLVSEEDSAAIAAYLATLRDPEGTETTRRSASTGEALFKTLQCGVCHSDDFPLDNVRRKFQDGVLQRFLLNPQEHYRWNRMPNFKLSDGEAADLAAFLTRDQSSEPTPVGHPNARGRELLQTTGCLNCHAGPVPNQHRAKPLAAIMGGSLGGCLDADDPRTPRFAFGDGEREALVAFLNNSRVDALTRDSPWEFALRRTSALSCAKCHDSTDGVIRVDLIGGKLRPEWVQSFLHGDIPYKPRPWLAARMPIFPAHSKELAAGIAALHGVPPVSPPEAPINMDHAAIGAKLISAAGGFSCVACHAVGRGGGSSIVESAGINFVYSGERMLHSFFHRWVMNPIAIDPATKMPLYFDEFGRSQLVEFFDGDATEQIEAMWQYVRLGEKMPPPPAP
jgi:mono/diheme cytochrome c family protein